jgi:hypothetical protein
MFRNHTHTGLYKHTNVQSVQKSQSKFSLESIEVHHGSEIILIQDYTDIQSVQNQYQSSVQNQSKFTTVQSRSGIQCLTKITALVRL